MSLTTFITNMSWLAILIASVVSATFCNRECKPKGDLELLTIDKTLELEESFGKILEISDISMLEIILLNVTNSGANIHFRLLTTQENYLNTLKQDFWCSNFSSESHFYCVQGV